MTASSLSTPARTALLATFGPDKILEHPGAPYDRDSSMYTAIPELVVFAECTEDVQQLLRLANEHGFAVVPRGGGTGTSGGCIALYGGVVLSLERMNRIVSIDTDNLVAVVQAGVITQALRDAAAARGLFYPPDPAGMDASTIGGNVATNAGGPACVKYGVTRDYVLGVEAVTPTGERIRAGVQTRKGVVGYDMAHLLCGSEGTLGVITEMTLKLVPLPAASVSMAAVFASMADAMRAVTSILTSGHLPCALEFLDHKCLHLQGDDLPFRVPGERASLLIVELDGVREQIVAEVETITARCTEHGATQIMPGGTPEERERIWSVRRETSTRIRNHAPIAISEDIVVPIGSIAPFIERVPEFEQEYGLDIFCFGHAGDGNIHLIVTAPERSGTHRVDEGIRAIARLVLDMGGTLSGEHGVGESKKLLLPMEISPESLRLQRGIRHLFDPAGILNPGKVFPEVE